MRFFLLLRLAGCLFCGSGFCQSVDRYPIIPRPARLEPRTGNFMLSPVTTVTVPFANVALKAMATEFANELNRTGSLTIRLRDINQKMDGLSLVQGNQIWFRPSLDTTIGAEGYRLDVTDKLVTVEAITLKGFFYAVQTLYQLLPPAVLKKVTAQPDSSSVPWSIPNCRIQDQPRYAYRGMNLDVSRHFFSVDYVKKYIDLMALHKFNTFHWHLTDDQGWRIEIKKYPKLTQIGSQRRETIVGHYDDYDPQVFDGKPYGGFYTQEEIKEVVRYAATKYITVVPEIEMPGHALAALSAYPELGCTPGPFQSATKWGVFEDVFCPTETTFTFLENVLTEVMSLFPGKYIHIGGDECPKTAWKKSDFCQQLMKREGLKTENELQRYFISRIDKFVTTKGRRIIGWDEILEGGLSPNATVMSWRGTKGGIEAARQRHDVVMTPGTFCYFDHYQGDPSQEPMGFGGSLPLAQVYAYNPTASELSADEATHILGVQGNVWTEYIETIDHLEYMIWPRAAALAEVAWSPLTRKDYADFTRRLTTHFERLANQNVNYARTIYDVIPAARPTPAGQVEVSLAADAQFIPEIRYTVDGSIPSGESPRYEKPLLFDKSTTIRVATFRDGKPLSQLAKVQKEYLVSKATGKSYTLLNAPTTGRPDKNYSLTNGTVGGMGGYEVTGVVSFTTDLNMVLDLGVPQQIQTVRVGFLKYTAKNMCLPKEVEVSVSDDGQVFRPATTVKTNAAEGGKRAIVRLPVEFAPTTARYVRIIARKVEQVPTGLRYPGRTAQLAIDEIEVR